MKRAQLVVLAGLALGACAAAWWLLHDAAPGAPRAGGAVVVRPLPDTASPPLEVALPHGVSGTRPEAVQPLLPDAPAGAAGSGRVRGPARRVPVLVRGEDGEPVAGALVAAEDDSGARSDPTDEAGRTVLRLREDTPTLKAWAFRRSSSSVRVPGPDVPLDDEHPLVVVLRRRNALQVRVRGPGGAPLGPLQLGLKGGPLLFASMDRNGPSNGALRVAPDPAVYAAGMSPLEDGSARKGPFLGRPGLRFRIDDDGLAEIFDLIPGLPFEVSVLDGGSPAWGPQAVTLDPDEWRVLSVQLEREPVDLVVRAVDAQRQPLAGAKVVVASTEKKPIAEQQTDQDGWARFEHLYLREVSVAVKQADYLPVEPVLVALSPGMLPVDVVLTKGLRVHLVLRDARGQPVPVARLNVSMDGKPVGVVQPDGPPDPETNTVSVTPKTDDPELQVVIDKARKENKLPRNEQFASWTLTTLPPGELLISLPSHGLSLALRHDSRDPEAVLVVPGGGELLVRFALDVDTARPVALVVQRRDEAAARLGESAVTKRLQLDGVITPSFARRVSRLPAGAYDVWLTAWEGRVTTISAVSRAFVIEGETTDLTLVAP